MAFVIENFYESYVLLFQLSGISFLHVSNKIFLLDHSFCWAGEVLLALPYP